MMDRPDLLSADALQTDAHPAIHLFYAHGSVHRSFLANTDDEINFLADKNARELSACLGLHGVIVLGYSGWDDCLLRALQQTSNFRHNLYWLVRDEASLSPEVSDFLSTHPSAYWVKITDGGEFMASLHERLCPGMRNTELLSNPIRPLREQLEQVVLTGVARETSVPEKTGNSAENMVTVSAPTTPEEFRQQIVNLLEDAERRFIDNVADLDPAARIRKLEHQADLAYSSRDWLIASDWYTKTIDDSAADAAQRAKAYFRRGYAFSRLSRSGQAIADYTCAIDLPGASPEQVARALVNRGLTHGQQGRPGQEIADYTRAIDLPGAPPEQVAKAYLGRGLSFEQTNDLEKARIDWKQVTQLNDVPPDIMQSAKNLLVEDSLPSTSPPSPDSPNPG